MSLRQFKAITKSGGIPNAITDSVTGDAVYLAVKVDMGCKGSILFHKGRREPCIDWGFLHDPRDSALFLMCFRDLFMDYCKRIYSLESEVAELKYVGYLEKVESEKGVIEKHTDILKGIFGDVKP